MGFPLSFRCNHQTPHTIHMKPRKNVNFKAHISKKKDFQYKMLQKRHELVMQDLNIYCKKYVSNVFDLVIFILQLLCTYVEGAQIVMTIQNYQQFISDPKVPKKCKTYFRTVMLLALILYVKLKIQI